MTLNKRCTVLLILILIAPFFYLSKASVKHPIEPRFRDEIVKTDQCILLCSISGHKPKREIILLNNHVLIIEYLDPLLPHFPSIVENVTISHGRKAVLKCEVENLRNFKVTII